MTVPAGPRRAVAVLGSGAAWESEALRLLAPARDLVVVKRCVDLPDLLATATTGQLDVAVLDGTTSGLDAPALALLRRHGTATVGVAPQTHHDRLLGLGITSVLEPDELAGLARRVSAARPAAAGGSGPVAAAEPDGPPSDLTAGPGGRLVAVWGPTGAPGRTTVAVGIAGALAARSARPVLLADLDPFGGAVAQHLGVLDEVSGLLAAARLAGTGQLDADRMAAVLRCVDGVEVLTGLPRADRWSELRPAALDRVLDVARARGDVVADTGFCLEHSPSFEAVPSAGRHAATLTALEAADAVVVVASADPVGLSRLARGLVELRQVLAPAGEVHVVVNRMRPTLGWSEREITGMVEGFVTPASTTFLPDDRAAADAAMLRGVPVSTADGALGTGLRDLAASLAGQTSRPVAAGRRRRRRG